MKKYQFKLALTLVVLWAITLVSCDDNAEEIVIPSIEPSQSNFDVDYNEGQVTIDFESNVIFYASINDADKQWLSYKFTNLCKTLEVTYLANDSTASRSGTVTVVKDDVEVAIAINQEGNPNAGNGSLQQIELNYSVSTAGGFTTLSVTADEASQIPIGSTVVLKSGESGNITFANPANYSTLFAAVPANGLVSFVYTAELAEMAASGGLFAILRDGFEVTEMYALYTKTNLEYSISTAGGFTTLSGTVEEAEKIEVGATVVLECGSSGNITFANPTNYSTIFYGEPANGKVSFAWTQEMADIASTAGFFAILRDGFELNSMYSIYVENELAYTVSTAGGFTTLSATAEVSSLIPIGATVVLECNDSGTITFANPTDYSTILVGTPSNGEVSFEWTEEMATIAATGGMFAILRDGFEITRMYCHN